MDSTQLSQSVLGFVLDPTSADYDDVRRIHNGLIDKRPALIVRCRGVADIVDAVRYAVTNKLEISVRVAATMSPDGPSPKSA